MSCVGNLCERLVLSGSRSGPAGRWTKDDRFPLTLISSRFSKFNCCRLNRTFLNWPVFTFPFGVWTVCWICVIFVLSLSLMVLLLCRKGVREHSGGAVMRKLDPSGKLSRSNLSRRATDVSHALGGWAHTAVNTICKHNWALMVWGHRPLS